MTRRSCIILLAILIALQAALGGLSICLDGGCCHVEARACAAAQPPAFDHEHSAIVTAGESHRCDCADFEVAEIEIVCPTRDDAAATDVTIAIMRIGRSDSAVHPVECDVPRPRPTWHDAAASQRLNVIRSTRLLL